MSRFVQADLSALGDVPAVDPAVFDTIRSERNAHLIAALALHGVDYDVTNLETDPLVIAYSEGGGANELQLRQRLNEAVRALSLAKARAGNLDHIAATYYGIARQSDTDDDGNVVLEDDERFRARVALAPEAFSTAGPLGAYVFHAIELDGVPDIADAWAYSEEDAATYTAGLFADAYSAGQRGTPFAGRATGNPVLAPEVLVLILPTLAYGPCDQALLDRAYAAVTARDVRPLGDNVRIEPAQVVNYSVNMTVTYQRGADPTPLIAEARRRVEAFVAARRKVGVAAERLGIGGAAYIAGIEKVTLASPASDVAGGSKQAPNCAAITITAVQSEGTWS